MHLGFCQSTLRLTSKSQVAVQAGFLPACQQAGRTPCKPNMADQSDKELAAVFDLRKISLSKADPTLDKSNAFKGLVVAAVGRAEAAGELKGGKPNRIAADVCVTLRHLTGGLLAAGESCCDTGLKVRPYVSVIKKHSRGAVSGDMVMSVRTDLQAQCQTQIDCRLSTLLFGSLGAQASSPNQMWRR
ncbi:hypothetical protein ABBQ32_012378 [Trebouxia sp. C0010 RCD-2024]